MMMDEIFNCPNCFYPLTLLEHRRKYKCAKCSQLFLKDEIESKEFRKWNKEQRMKDRKKEGRRYRKEYIKKNKERLNLWRRNYYYKNKERIREIQKKSMIKNKEKIRKRQQEWRKKNLDRARRTWRKYHKKNKDILNAKRRERYRLRGKKLN